MPLVENDFAHVTQNKVTSSREREEPWTGLKRVSLDYFDDPSKRKALFLLTNYISFDKFSEDEQEDILEDVVEKWLHEKYEDQASLWSKIHGYCESKYLMAKLGDVRNYPNPMATALCWCVSRFGF